MTARTQEILSAIDTLIRTHDAWALDRNSPEQPSEALDESVDPLIQAAFTGDIPLECRTLIGPITDFCEGWLDWREGEWEPDNYSPKRRVWDAFTELRRAREKINKREVKRVESVSQLRSEKVGDRQIAIIYGMLNPRTGLYEGPFHENGEIRHDLIEQQHRAEQGQGERVIPEGWVHPMNDQIEQANISNLTQRMRTIGERVAVRETPPDKGNPEELAKGGAFPHQVKYAFPHLSDEDVRELYIRLELDPDMRPDLGSEPPKPKETDSKSETEPESSLAELVLLVQSGDETLGAPDIARKVKEEFQKDVTPQQVTKILKKQKQAVAS